MDSQECQKCNYTYSIGFTGNSKIKENKISEYNIVVDSLAVGDLVNKEKKTNFPSKKPSKAIYNIVSFRKPLFP